MEQLVHLRNKNAKRFYVGFRTRDLTVRFRLWRKHKSSVARIKRYALDSQHELKVHGIGQF